LVHVSELGEKSFLHPRDVVQEGQSVQVRVIDIDPKEQRLRLSLRLNGAQSQKNRDGDQANDVSHKVPPPPPPPMDPGYWESLAESGM